MGDHQHYDELAALSAGGLLSDQETSEFHEHAKACPVCLRSEQAYRELVRAGLPLTASPIGEFVQVARTRSDEGIRARFLSRARREGVVFSPEIQLRGSQQPQRRGAFAFAAAAVAAMVLVAGGFYAARIYREPLPQQSRQEIEQLQREKIALSGSLVDQERQIENLRAQLAAASKDTEELRRGTETPRAEVLRSSSQMVQFPAELENRDKQLEEARREIQRINQLQLDNEASLVAQQVKIAELSDQLRVASATLEMERQLAAEGKDIRELLVARQLHVIDVRDTDANGKPGRAFGRVFVSEGKSLTFYAFDLGESRAIDAKRRFEVWGAQQAKTTSAQSLGFLYVDDKSQRRWALKVNNPEVLKEVNSVFVTLEPAAGSSKPSGQAMLYAYLGQPNHP